MSFFRSIYKGPHRLLPFFSLLKTTCSRKRSNNFNSRSIVIETEWITVDDISGYTSKSNLVGIRIYMRISKSLPGGKRQLQIRDHSEVVT